MAALADDCFAFGGHPMTVDEAIATMLARIGAVTAAESLPVRACRSRLLAEDVVSTRAVPPHANAAVDGYAVFHADLATDTPTVLPVEGRAAAGHPFTAAHKRGTALRIFTGAPLPAGEGGGPGPDTVVMQEDCREADGSVTLPPGIRRGANRRRAGEDVEAGAVVLRAGRRLAPQDLGLAAAIGRTGLAVHAPLKVAVFSTGDELREAGAALPEGCVYDANRQALLGLVDGLGCCAVTDLGILPDRPDAVRAALSDAAAGHDVLITSGGVSGGEEDHVKAAVEALGTLHLWRMAIKPGRPVALGQVARVPFIGLPGNPVAAMVTFLAVARPLLFTLAGAAPVPQPHSFTVTAGFAYDRKPGRREYLRVRLEADPARPGAWIARKYPQDGSGVLTSMVAADGLLIAGEALSGIAAGDALPFLPFAALGI